MKKHNKALICAFAAGLALLAAAPSAASAAEEKKNDTPASSDPETADAPAKEGWSKDENGRLFYIGKDGNALTGEQTIDGTDYLFSKNGVLKTGWRTVKGVRRYYDPETGKPEDGWFEYAGEKFYIDTKTGKASGVYKDTDGSLWLMSETGTLIGKKGFTEYEGSFYYITDDGRLASGKQTIDGSVYLFDDFGREYVGWNVIDGADRYYDPKTGLAKTGIIETPEGIFYADPKSGRTQGIVEFEGDTYFFGSDYTMQKGIIELGGSKYLFGEDGKQVRGVGSYDGKLYYLNDETGQMETPINNVGRRMLGGKKYFINSDLTLATGIKEIDGSKYFFSEENGEMQTGIVKTDGSIYCFGEEDGKMITGRRIVDSSKYYFDPDTGAAAVGWRDLEDGRYFFDSDGKMIFGWNEIDGIMFYFDPDKGVMKTGWIKSDNAWYYLRENGAMATGWVKDQNSWFYLNSDGKMATGWIELDGKKYHLASNGKMDTNCVIDDLNLAENGVAYPLSNVQKRAKELLASNGKTPHDIYSFAAGNNRYDYMENTRTLDEIENVGWGYFANYALDNRKVVCYYFAALTDLLFKQAGYQTRIVKGTGRATSEHYWNQVYINGKWLNYDACNGFEGVSLEYLMTPSERTGKGYTVEQYVNAKYY